MYTIQEKSNDSDLVNKCRACEEGVIEKVGKQDSEHVLEFTSKTQEQ